MNHLLNITKKELKELLTPGTIISILVVVIMFSALGNMMSEGTESETSPKNIGIVFDGDLSQNLVVDAHTLFSVETLIEKGYLYNYNVSNPGEYIHHMDAAFGNDQAIVDELRDKGYDAVIAINPNFVTNVSSKSPTQFEAYYTYTNGGLFSSMTGAIAANIIASMNSQLSKSIIDNTILDGAAFAENPIRLPNNATHDTNHTVINGKICDDVTPYEIYSTMMGQNMMIPIIVMIVIIMVGSVVISSMGNEKENKTLETLLTLPIKRTTVVSGKLLAAAIMGLVYGVCYLAGMMMYTNGMTSGLTGSKVDLTPYGLTMDPLDWVILMAILFLAIFSALGICMILGAFTKNYKMAQTMTLPISGLALIPMLVFMFSSWEVLPTVMKGLMFIIPFTHPMMAMDNLMFGSYLLVFEGIAYLLVFDIIVVLITVKIYNSDILITGLGQTKIGTKLSKLTKSKRSKDGDN